MSETDKKKELYKQMKKEVENNLLDEGLKKEMYISEQNVEQSGFKKRVVKKNNKKRTVEVDDGE